MSATAVERKAVSAPPPSVCPKCGGAFTRYKNGRGVEYRRCDGCRYAKRRLLSTTKTGTKRCADCGGRLPHKGKEQRCPATRHRYLIERGRQRIERQWPGYAAVLPEHVLANAGHNKRVAYPPPSQLVPGVAPGMDAVLMRAQQDKNVALCRELAGLTPSEQSTFFTLYLADPADARHWARLPTWKRPIRKGDITDQYIWKFFVQQRLNMAALAEGRTIDWKAQGYQWTVMAACFRYIKDPERFATVLGTFADLLHRGQELGDVQRPPWQARQLNP